MPKIVDRDLYRQQLLQQSFEFFAEIGYGNITMRQLAEKLGVSTGTLYHYFPSKQAMFLQLVAEQTQADIRNFMTEVAEAPLGTRSRIKAILDFVDTHRDYFTKQAIVTLDYCQQHRRKDPQSASLFELADREYMLAASEYLEIEDPAIVGLILNFINGLIFGNIYQSKFSSWEVQSELFATAIAKLIDR